MASSRSSGRAASCIWKLLGERLAYVARSGTMAISTKAGGEAIFPDNPSVHIMIHDEDTFAIKTPTFLFSLSPGRSSCLHVP